MKLCHYEGVVSCAPDATAADQPQNAMLLRADIHKLFDGYIWSIYQVSYTMIS